VDDEESILENYRLILGTTENVELQSVLNRRLARKRDQSISFQIQCVSSGEDALATIHREKAAGNRFAVAFVDMKMPGGIDGLETIVEMKKIDPDILVAVVTAYTDRTVLQISDAFEFQDQWIYFNKPFSEGELIQTARNLVASWNLKRVHQRALQMLEDSKEKEVAAQIAIAEMERKKAMELTEAYTNLEATKNRLVHAEKLSALGQFAAGIAHDFNNILGSISGYAELGINNVPVGTSLERYLRQILKASGRAEHLIKQIMRFSRQDVDEKQPVRLGQCVSEVIDLLKAALPSSIDLQYSVIKESGPIRSNPAKINEVLMNLCSNAAHAMNYKGLLEVSITEELIEIERRGRIDTMKPALYSKLTVRDHGHGIFTTKKQGEGTGLGLSVVYGIMKDHEGDIMMESRLGEGTTFELYFPQIKQQTSPNGDPLFSIPMGKERILFIDDEEMLAVMSKDLVEMLGYAVTFKTSSKEALEEFRAHAADYDMVITDQTMPEMTGLELAPRLREIRPDIPIILCTGFSNMVDESSAQEAGIKAFLFKPLTQKELGETIRKYLDNKGD
jgi:CheY-like chemotaxis protein